MLLLLEGSFNSELRNELKQRIEKNIRDNKKCILIVPEQQTVIAEWEFALEFDPSAPLYFEVTNFTRFANSVFRRLGGIQKKYADKVKKSLIMWQTLTELSPFLSVTSGRREVSAGLTERTVNAVKESEALGFTPEILAAASNAEGIGGKLSEKLSDLSKILTLYKSKLTERYADTADDCRLLAEKLEENKDFLSDTEIFIEGFTSFTVPQYELVAKLLKRTNITVALNIPKADSGAYEYAELTDTQGRLIALADKCCADKKLLRFDGRRNVKSDALFELCPLLWKSNRRIDSFSLKSIDEFRIFEAANPFEECEFIASDIKRRVMNGASYRDFAIVMGNDSDYDGILDTCLDKADIVHFSSVKSELMSFEAIRMIFTALSAATGFSRDDVLAYASCGLSGISSGERDEFELYVDKWQISEKLFTPEHGWNMNPSGFDDRSEVNIDKALGRLNATRVKLITPLAKLDQKLSFAKSIEEHASALLSFLEDISLEEALIERAERLIALGEESAAEDNLKLYKIICNSLDTIVEVIGDKECDRDSFAAQLKIIFSASDIGRIPASYDEVTVGAADMLRLAGKKHIYLIGVNYGKFPSSGESTGYFTDKDKEMLALAGIEADSDSEIRISRQLYSFSRAFASARESVTVTYPRTDSSFGALSPSSVIENIKSLTNGEIEPVKISSIAPRDKFYAAEIAVESINECSDTDKKTIKSVLEESGKRVFAEDETIENCALELTSNDGVDSLHLNQSKIDTFISCPLEYFCQHTLSLSGGERARFGANNIGSYIHTILEIFFSEVKKQSLDVSALTEEQKDEMTRRAAKVYLDKFSNELGILGERTRSAIAKIYRASRPVVDDLCEEFKESRFTPLFFELPIGRLPKSGPEHVTVTTEDGKTITIGGIIDRVDTFKHEGNIYVRVIDYKTGKKVFNPAELAEGKNLQMFLYLKAITESKKESFREALGVEENGEIIPAGLIYVKTDVNDQRINSLSDDEAILAIKGAQKRMGMVLNDEVILAAMGKDRLPVSFKIDGAPDKRSEKLLFTKEGWEALSDTVRIAVEEIGGRILSGDISASEKRTLPKNSPCENCPYKAFCRSFKA